MPEVVKHDKAAHGHPVAQDHPHQHVQAIRPIGQGGQIVLRNDATDRHAGRGVQQGQNRIQNSAADVFKVDIDTVRHSLFQQFGKARRLVIDAGIKAERIDHMRTFISATRDTDHTAAHDLGHLTHGRAHRATCGGNNKRLAFFGFADLGQSAVGRQPRHAHHAKRPGRVLRVFAHVDRAHAIGQGIILPATASHNPIASFKALHIRCHDLRDRAANHHAADLNRDSIGLRVAHPAAHIGVKRQVLIAQQHLPRTRRWHVARFQTKGILIRLAHRAFGQNKLTVHGIGLGHGGYPF